MGKFDEFNYGVVVWEGWGGDEVDWFDWLGGGLGFGGLLGLFRFGGGVFGVVCFVEEDGFLGVGVVLVEVDVRKGRWWRGVVGGDEGGNFLGGELGGYVGVDGVCVV